MPTPLANAHAASIELRRAATAMESEVVSERWGSVAHLARQIGDHLKNILNNAADRDPVVAGRALVDLCECFKLGEAIAPVSEPMKIKKK